MTSMMMIQWLKFVIFFVYAIGPVEEEILLEFVREVERIGQDSLYWVRTEVSFAIGALAKVVPAEIVRASLVSVHMFSSFSFFF
jgi:serine/threonine-protein phosphatase 4 regulatory subunit 1